MIKFKTEKLTEGEYSFVDDHYTNSKTKHNFLHHVCGTVFKKSWDKFKGTPKQPGQRCTECYRKGMESVASRYTRDVLDHLHIEYECEKRFDDCINPKTGKTLPFDYYISEINTLIEIDGEQHERSSFSKYDHEGTVERDKIKNIYTEEKEIELVRIPAKKWSQLPEFLYEILSKNLIPTLTLEEVKKISHSTHPERINKDLQKVHNGEYALHDPYYFGVDREHNFKHLTCGTVFEKTLYTLKTHKCPCPVCNKAYKENKSHKRISQDLFERSNCRYSLDNSHIGKDKKNRRLVCCNHCNTSWFSDIGNLYQNNGGCPTCQEMQRDKEWKERHNGIVQSIKADRKLEKSQTHWLWQNKRKYTEGKLKPERLKLLQEENLI